ncbi:bifunctional enoyl-CoA hydratase/phosphate acetyltransferase [candidate division WOR-3 bacterium]|nr:bifunctional enoyl-CoA hydratase/phosphate acetyltransferase [candidate division WOR-3 bacterium]
MIKNMEELVKKAVSGGKKILSVACAEDENVLEAIARAVDIDLAYPLLFGDKGVIVDLLKKIGIENSRFEIVDVKDENEAVRQAVSAVSSGQADFLMKGLVSTSKFLKNVLDKEYGLRSSQLLSHAAILSLPSYHKLLIVTDGGMNEHPDIGAKIHILENSVRLCEKLGIVNPKVAVLAGVETVSEKQPETVDAAQMSKMNFNGQIKNCVVDGPLAIDAALSSESATHKNIKSPVAGDADIFMVPSMSAGNMLAKSLIYLASAQAAGAILGTSKPVVMLSRSDEPKTKLNSIALGSLLAQSGKAADCS